MLNMLLQKSASSELWWVAGAMGLFLGGLVITLIVRYVNKRRSATPADGPGDSSVDELHRPI